MRQVTVAATQMACGPDSRENVERAERLVRRAALQGADLILLQELFAHPYFCKDQKAAYFDLALPADRSPLLDRMRRLAAELGVVLPVSFFERANNVYFNSVAVIDADGHQLGIYRKSHIPDGPGYQEKFYFSPGDTGFRAWRTRAGTIGVGICWDQWFPEAARAMVLMGAEILLYPTAIGSEPQDPEYDSSDHWQTVMRGHAAANMVPVVASNPASATNRASPVRSRSTGAPSSPTPAGPSSPRRTGSARRCCSPPSISTSCGANVPPGACSGIGVRTCTCRS